MKMALLQKAILNNPKTVQKTIGIFYNVSRNHWNYQYKPGPYPKTNEERAAAAKKYGLTIEEYTPYPESMGYGDYPKLPDIGADSKDPHYPWDMPELKRNFNEPVHALAELYGEDRYDISMRPRFPVWYQACFLFAVLGGSFALYYYLEDFKMGRPVLVKQYPKDGPHYMFECE
ncbi:NADH dehydrogenase [ubiquinone] 1 beta subcomplex subunit 8, mitochondrial [Hyposmocoma kahamanoa]|uniref:NADH dehydrogenase [ubiquinone] 1 beta subcomplex subunit 8, mitochondrial n=1 Tax=Hyposmocoma kahamanoa TaxID=1477025 RepID=UPI000E6D69E8|nr:NADH dehydrogenase [ubiquinone] 1 beta subcomplex subunit 8, mitochondrial [Hyposmocoma kahamanoa]